VLPQFFEYSICIILIITGITGCSFETPRNYLGGERVLTSITIYYALLSVYLLVYALYYYLSANLLSPIVFLLKSFVALISAYGLYQAASRWKTKVENVTETLLYLSVIYLLGKTSPFDELGKKVVTEMAILPVFVSVVIVVFTAFVTFRIKQANIPFFFDRFDVLRVNFIYRFNWPVLLWKWCLFCFMSFDNRTQHLHPLETVQNGKICNQTVKFPN